MVTDSRRDEPVSPCVSICRLDPDTQICTGCLRTLDEIAAWGRLDRQGRHRVLAAVERRRTAAAARQPARGCDSP